MKIGLPIMANSFTVNLQTTLDRLFLIKLASPYELGIYQFGVLPLTLATVLNGIINQYLGPKLLYEYGRDGSLKHVFKKCFQVSLTLAAVLTLAWPLGVKLIEFVVPMWFPQYKNSIPIITIFCLGAAFTSANVFGATIIAANKQVFSLISCVIITFFCLISYVVTARYGGGMVFYAFINVGAQILGFLLNCGMSYFFARSACSEDRCA